MNAGKYSAITVARFLIDMANEIKSPISNLQLQKILFFAWRDYYSKNRIYLFSDEIQAWQYGHVVPSVYYEYFRYSGMRLIFRYTTDLDKSDIEFLSEILRQYSPRAIFELVDESHGKGGSWDKVYEPFTKQTVPFESIIANDCT